jgi:ATP-dependent DNA helicase RecG
MEKYSDEISQSISTLNGVGVKTKSLLSEIGIESLFDLLSIPPIDLIDKKEIANINDAYNGEMVVVSGEVIKAVKTRGFRPHYILTIQSASGIFYVRFIHKIIVFMNLKKGINLRVSGVAIVKGKRLELIHPEVEMIKDSVPLANIVPKYSLRGKVSQSKIRKLVRQAFSIFSRNYQFTCLDDYFNQEFKSMSLLKALKKLHFPEGTYEEAMDGYILAKQRVAFEEIYLHKHEFLKTVEKFNKKRSFEITINRESMDIFFSSLPFSLTTGQLSAINKINKSISNERASKVLIQGDVGCGKTIVAIIACYHALKNNHQCLVLVPTEVLCSQHFKTFTEYLSSYGTVEMISGKNTKAEKESIKCKLSIGEISVLIGTHALLFNDYKFKSLAIVIIDEQHKFGIKQREKISSDYDKQPHLIYMSATPIPRTLALVLYENMNYITISDKPSNRDIIKTIVYDDGSRTKIYDNVSKHLRDGMQVYWVCTRIEDREDSDKQSVNIFSNTIKEFFPIHKVRVLHGKLSSDEKIKIINAFKSGEIDILVSTSVIEVGIDCPNANCLVIENSELFGLAQIHQLRGRVGRGATKGYCYLIHSDKTKPESIEKLKYLEMHHSGFDVAEYDLKTRGTGTYLGNKQSGMPDNYRVSNINDIMDNISYIKSFKFELSSARISELKKRWKIKSINEVQL